MSDHDYFKDESNTSKLWRMTKQNPIVPLGALATVGVLGAGILAMKRGDNVAAQRMMRYRVAAQGVTVGALTVGGIMQLEQEKKRKREAEAAAHNEH